jgi:hypothetical protein
MRLWADAQDDWETMGGNRMGGSGGSGAEQLAEKVKMQQRQQTKQAEKEERVNKSQRLRMNLEMKRKREEWQAERRVEAEHAASMQRPSSLAIQNLKLLTTQLRSTMPLSCPPNTTTRLRSAGNVCVDKTKSKVQRTRHQEYRRQPTTGMSISTVRSIHIYLLLQPMKNKHPQHQRKATVCRSQQKNISTPKSAQLEMKMPPRP